MTDKDRPRLLVTAGVFALFAYALWYRVEDDMVIGALIGAFGMAVGYWLASSKGSSDKSSSLDAIATEPRRVVVDQPPDKPVPVDPQG